MLTVTTFGDTLRRLRKAAGLSQTDLADKAGVRIDSFRNWEQGRWVPRLDAAAKLAKVLNVSLDVLAQGMADEPEEEGS